MIFTACRIGFLQEIPRSWDYWLKGGDTELRHRNWDRNIYRKFF
jgi:hypothetical protein